jgi:hypothetical protein
MCGSYKKFKKYSKPFLQLHVPVQLPCYDFVPISHSLTLIVNYQAISNDKHFPNLKQATFQTVTGGLYRAPLQIHRNFADLRLLAIPTSWFQVAETNPISKTFKDLLSTNFAPY